MQRDVDPFVGVQCTFVRMDVPCAFLYVSFAAAIVRCFFVTSPHSLYMQYERVNNARPRMRLTSNDEKKGFAGY